MNSSGISSCSPDIKNTSKSAISTSDLEFQSSAESPVSNRDSSIDEKQCELNIEFNSSTAKDSPESVSNSAIGEDRCEFTIDFGESSPKKDNKENIAHR